MAGLTQRNGIYYLTWREDGKLRKRSTQTRNRTQADRIRSKFEQNRIYDSDDRFSRYQKIKLIDQLSEYRAYQIAEGVTEKQANQVTMRATRVLSQTGMTYISDLSESRVRIAISGLTATSTSKKQSHSPRRKISARTRNGYLRAMLQFCGWMVRDRRMTANPLCAMREENESVDKRHERAPLNDEQFRTVYETARASDKIIEGFDGRTRAAIYLLAFYSGLRRKEMASLTPRSFNLDPSEPSVTVEAAYSKHRRLDVIVLPRQIPGLIPMDPEKPDDPIFPKLAGRKTHKMLRRDLEAASIPYVTENGKFHDLHSLRHAYITRLWNAGATPVVARTMARHSDLRETMRYSHTNRNEERKIADRIGSFLEHPEPDS